MPYRVLLNIHAAYYVLRVACFVWMLPLSDTALGTVTVFSRELANRKYGIANTLYILTVISRYVSDWIFKIRKFCTHTTSLLRSKKYSTHTHKHTHTHTHTHIYIYKGKLILLQARCGPEGG